MERPRFSLGPSKEIRGLGILLMISTLILPVSPGFIEEQDGPGVNIKQVTCDVADGKPLVSSLIRNMLNCES
jgi:hypothetical protein